MTSFKGLIEVKVMIGCIMFTLRFGSPLLEGLDAAMHYVSGTIHVLNHPLDQIPAYLHIIFMSLNFPFNTMIYGFYFIFDDSHEIVELCTIYFESVDIINYSYI